ncbi:hypothetical protein DPMN_156065 [Dreissena polymorpha]|uniref:Uncharacterized protein n=1 Tax=Dreissena polymorpha TaxID=45954 RepID=A0A9D4FNC7_DREPO|nr:hypothetical protein DPMN_156065 [Dreissena polymorpha]
MSSRPSSTLPPMLLPSHFRRCSKTTIHLRQLPFRLAILPSSGSQLSQQERTSWSRDDGSRLMNRVARGSSNFRPSGDVAKQLSTYGQLPFRLAILRSL